MADYDHECYYDIVNIMLLFVAAGWLWQVSKSIIPCPIQVYTITVINIHEYCSRNHDDIVMYVYMGMIVVSAWGQ